MRQCVIVAIVLTMSSTVVQAQSAKPANPAVKSERNFVAKFKKIADDCKDPTLRFSVAQVTITQQRRKRSQMKLGRALILRGSLTQTRFSMVARRPSTVITASGSVRKGIISMLVIAEHYRGKTPVCTQTWNAKGKRGVLPRKR